MSWDARGQHGPYFYHSIRQDGRVRKVYVGRGQPAEKLARQIEQRRQEYQARREALRQEVAQIAVAELRLKELQELANLLVQGVLLAAGLREHRGQWRKRRYSKED